MRRNGFLKVASVLMLGILMIVNSFAVSEISVNDAPEGWASYIGKKDLAGGRNTPPDATKGTIGGQGGEVFTVKNRTELLNALNKGDKRIIYVEGVIDMTDTGNGSLIPSTYSGSTSELDKMIEKYTADSVLPCKNYSEWKTKYTASFNYTEDQSGDIAALRNKMNEAWKNLIYLNIKSNTTLIGVDENAGIRGGSIYVKDAQNVIIRNLNIGDCYNPFPEIQADDGLNADFDCVVFRKSKYVWLDHCTLYSTFSAQEIEKDKYSTKDHHDVKWQVYDGLCDIVQTNDFVTVSWCIFRNHDKTMLVGNSDKVVADINHQTITLHHNWFDGCTQRLPMVRFATIHIYNNVYTNQKKYGIDRRKDCKVYSECNSFEETIRSLTANKHGSFFDKGSVNIKKENMDSKPSWNPSDYYKYKAESAEKAKKLVMSNAGTAKLK
ncbi:MAG: hypothetical protein IJ312_06330 [Treponema sp.]|nr:hypothetical protein [Treponema sp.]